MNYRQHLLAVITGLFVLFNFACAGDNHSSADAEVVFDDNYKPAKNGEIVIDDSSFGQNSRLSSKMEARQDRPVELNDKSILTVMYDAFGNKVEMREFPKDSRLLMVTVSTFANGKKETLVRGRNGERKTLPPEMFDRVLTTDANEIAQTAGIFESRREETYLPPVVAMQQVQPRQTYQSAQSTQVPQFSEKTVVEEDSLSETEQKPAEQKAEKTEEKSQPQQNSLQKNSTQPVTPKRKDIEKQ